MSSPEHCPQITLNLEGRKEEGRKDGGRKKEEEGRRKEEEGREEEGRRTCTDLGT